MKTKRPNPRLVKIHRNYTVEEIACLFGIHKNTVRSWIKMGLPVTDNCRPQLILGSELAAFLGATKISEAVRWMNCIVCAAVAPKNPKEIWRIAEQLPTKWVTWKHYVLSVKPS